MTAKTPLVLLALCLIALTGCPRKAPLAPVEQVIDYDAELPPGRLALRKITDPRQIPDFTQACADAAGLRQAIEHSLSYLGKPSSQMRFPCGQITHEQAVASLREMLSLLDSGMPADRMNLAIRERFDVYVSVGCDNQGTVLFTGYYTPIFYGSRVPTDRFKYPLYKPPPGLVKLPDGNPASPMDDRRTIESSGMYAGNELVYMADPFEAYVAHIQGSARLLMPDGGELTVGYAANNGHEYKSIRSEMVADGKIGKFAGLQAMLDYFKAHPHEVREYTWRNPRYVFFAVIEDGRPRGCLNEPVTVMRTIATDKKIFPPACLALIQARLPRRTSAGVVETDYSGFALDQDAGGAIRAAGRCDVYMGVGEPAGELAGRTQNAGRLYYLFLKPSRPAPTSLAPSTPAPATPPARG